MAEDFEVGGPPPEAPSNRSFVIAVGAIGGLLALSIICLGLYVLVLAPRQREASAARATQIVLNNTQVAQSLTQTSQALHPSPTFPPTKTPIPTETATPTQVVVIATPTDTPTQATVDPRTATAFAATLAALQATTPTPTATALPRTGFAEDIGLPGLVLLGMVLIVVVFVARQLRVRPAR
jgi:cytoskeletal protein RodZ